MEEACCIDDVCVIRPVHEKKEARIHTLFNIATDILKKRHQRIIHRHLDDAYSCFIVDANQHAMPAPKPSRLYAKPNKEDGDGLFEIMTGPGRNRISRWKYLVQYSHEVYAILWSDGYFDITGCIV